MHRILTFFSFFLWLRRKAVKLITHIIIISARTAPTPKPPPPKKKKSPNTTKIPQHLPPPQGEKNGNKSDVKCLCVMCLSGVHPFQRWHSDFRGDQAVWQDLSRSAAHRLSLWTQVFCPYLRRMDISHFSSSFFLLPKTGLHLFRKKSKSMHLNWTREKIHSVPTMEKSFVVPFHAFLIFRLSLNHPDLSTHTQPSRKKSFASSDCDRIGSFAL